MHVAQTVNVNTSLNPTSSTNLSGFASPEHAERSLAFGYYGHHKFFDDIASAKRNDVIRRRIAIVLK